MRHTLLLWRGVVSIPVYGDIGELGYYFLDVSIGTPAQRLSVIIDTGSTGLLVTCTNCYSCGKEHLDSFFSPESSSSFHSVCPTSMFRSSECLFNKHYLEGSYLKGRYVEDSVFENKMKFGCIESESRAFLTQKANGILGLAPQEVPVFDFFSLCLSSRGGEFHILSDQVPEVFIPLQYVEGHYIVSPMSVSVGNTTYSDEMLGKEVLIDSGSTITYFPQNLFSDIFSKINSTTCWDHIPSLPVILLVFNQSNGPELSVPFENYYYMNDQGRWCLSIASNGNLNRTDLGASWLVGKNVTISAKNKWISIQPRVDCPSWNLTQRVPTPKRVEESGWLSVVLLIGVCLSIAACLFKVVYRSVAYTRLPTEFGVE